MSWVYVESMVLTNGRWREADEKLQILSEISEEISIDLFFIWFYCNLLFRDGGSIIRSSIGPNLLLIATKHTTIAIQHLQTNKTKTMNLEQTCLG